MRWNGEEYFFPRMETERLFLRPFSVADTDALFLLLRDEKTNRFLPWFPCKTEKETEIFLKERMLYSEDCCFIAICEKTDGVPIGYVSIRSDESHDLGYAVRRELWGHGIATEACSAVIRQIKRRGIPYLTATHDVKNPASGAVMKKLGMTYRYSYREFWQPKGIFTVFRMYQIDLKDGIVTYQAYWNRYSEHWIEKI